MLNIERILTVALAAPRIPFSALEHFLNSSPAISGPAGPITHRMSGWFPGMRVGGVVVPDPNLVAEVTGALETSAGTLIPNPSVAPEDNILPIPSVDDSAPSEVDIFAGGAIPSVLPGGGVSEQPLPCGAPELHDPSYMSGISGVCPAWPVAKDAELPPYISDMKDFDMVKAFTPNTLVASQTPEAVGLWEVPEGAPITSVNTVFENTGLPTPIHPPILATVSVEQEETINSASPLSLVENLDRPSSPGALPVELESTGCNGEWAAFAGTPTEENQERTTSSSTENCQPINPIGASIEVDEAEIKSTSHINPNPISQSKPPSTDELAGADGGAIKFSFKKDSAIGATFGSDAEPPLESDACHTVLELVVQEPASPKHFLDGHQLHIPLPINHNSNFASPTKFLPGAPKANTADLRNEDSNSSGSVRPQAGHGEVGTPGTRESSSEDTATISAVIEGDSSPTISDVLAVRMEPTAEEATSTEAPMDESQPQTPGDISGNYQLPSERQVQAREGTSGTVPFITDDSNLDDLQDSDEETSIVEPTKGSRFHRPPSPIPHRLNWSLHRSAPLTIPVPDTMLQFFFSSKPPAPKWAPPTLYFPGGRIVNSVDPDYRFFDEVALFQPCPRPSAYARKTPLPRDNSQDARGLIPPKPKEKRKLSIYDFIDKISRVGKVVDPQIAINAKSVEDFVKAYYIVGPNGEPLLNNPPKGAIPQVKIQHEWIPTSIVERHRIERVIRLLDLEISPATRAALFWILIERQTERTRVLLKYLAEYPEPKLKDVETKLISWGYLPGKDQTMEDRIAIERKRPTN